MSYLSGPLSRTQIEGLQPENLPQTDTETVSPTTPAPADDSLGVKHVTLAPEIPQYFLPPTQVVTNPDAVVYQPALLGLLNIHYEDSKSDTRDTTQHAFITPFSDGAIAVDWRDAVEPFSERPDHIELINDDQPGGGRFIEPPAVAGQKNHYKDWEKALTLWVRQNRPLNLWRHTALKLYSQPNESESQFRQRIAIELREARDAETAKLREQIGKKLATLEGKLQRAEAKVQKEAEQASSKTMDAIIGAGTAIFSAFLSRKKISATNSRRLGSALRKAKGAFSERDDVGLAQQQADAIQADIDALGKQFETEQQNIAARYDAGNATLESVQLYPKASGVEVIAFGLAWQPGVVVDGAWRGV